MSHESRNVFLQKTLNDTPIRPRKSVKRRLFPVDENETVEDFICRIEKENAKENLAVQTRFNFEPILESPLEGEHEWETVLADEVPDLYHTKICGNNQKTEQTTDISNAQKTGLVGIQKNFAKKLKGLVQRPVNKKC